MSVQGARYVDVQFKAINLTLCFYLTQSAASVGKKLPALFLRLRSFVIS